MTAQPETLHLDFAKLQAERNGLTHRSPHVITITSGKGGVGKSNITVNLAWQLRQMRRRVLVFDADLGLANVDILLGLAPKFNVSHVFSGERRLREIVVKGPGGIKVLPASSGISSITDITEEQKLMLLEQLEELQAEYDFMLIDSGAGISNNVIYFALAAQTLLVVLTPEPTSLADAYALIKVLSKDYRQRRFKVLVNDVAGEQEGLDVFARLTTVTDRFLNVSVDYVGAAPRDPKIREAVRRQRPVMDLFGDSLTAQAMKKIGRKIVALENDPMRSDLGLLWRNVLVGSAA